jgi:hypothetical protein
MARVLSRAHAHHEWSDSSLAKENHPTTPNIVASSFVPGAIQSRSADRGERPAAFGRRCIPGGCVAPPSNTARYSQSSRLAGGAPRRPRCDAGLSPRADSEASPQTAKKDLGPIDRVVKVERLRLPRDSGEPSDLSRCAAVWERRCWDRNDRRAPAGVPSSDFRPRRSR